MKVAITGHTQGIGKAIAELYPDNLGFSRSNGYDISVETSREQIVQESIDTDIFINNAVIDNYQTKMFLQIFDVWKHDSNKTIVNINSRAKYLKSTDNEYWNAKKKLFDQVEKNLFGRRCKIININPGYVMTDSSKESIEKYNMPYMSTQVCANYVKWAIDQPMEIWEVSFWEI